jgi:hypothetical protein
MEMARVFLSALWLASLETCRTAISSLELTQCHAVLTSLDPTYPLGSVDFSEEDIQAQRPIH